MHKISALLLLLSTSSLFGFNWCGSLELFAEGPGGYRERSITPVKVPAKPVTFANLIEANKQATSDFKKLQLLQGALESQERNKNIRFLSGSGQEQKQAARKQNAAQTVIEVARRSCKAEIERYAGPNFDVNKLTLPVVTALRRALSLEQRLGSFMLNQQPELLRKVRLQDPTAYQNKDFGMIPVEVAQVYREILDDPRIPQAFSARMKQVLNEIENNSIHDEHSGAYYGPADLLRETMDSVTAFTRLSHGQVDPPSSAQ